METGDGVLRAVGTQKKIRSSTWSILVAGCHHCDDPGIKVRSKESF